MNDIGMNGAGVEYSRKLPEAMPQGITFTRDGRKLRAVRLRKYS